MDESRKEMIHDHVADMIAIERNILEALEKQYSDEDVCRYPAAYDFIRRVRGHVGRHIAALELYLKEEDSESVVQKLIGTVAGVAIGLYDKMRNDSVSRMIQDDYTALCLAAVNYHMLLATALCWNDMALAQICERNLDDLTELIPELGNLVCSIVGAELAEEGEIPNTGGGEEAFLRVKKAWSVHHHENHQEMHI